MERNAAPVSQVQTPASQTATERAGRTIDADDEPAFESTQSRLVATLQLATLPGLGPRTLTGLLERFGDPRAVLSASPCQLASVRGVGPKLVHVIQTASHYSDPEAIMRWCRDHHTEVVACDSTSYPSRLRELDDAPPLIFVRGGYVPHDDIAVAIVGTRHPTLYGLQQAERLARGLANAEVTVVSGLARGIDAAAHQGALDGGGRTIAVLGSGLGHLYPSEHAGLAEAITGSGVVLSEYPPDAKPRAGMFPQRNRLIAGLSLATLVVEAPDRSGALITARLAGEQNRDVLALPGPISSRASRGCNQLIRDGATLVQSVDDILEQLGPLAQPIETTSGQTMRHASELALNDVEQRVLQAIGPPSSLIDQVIVKSGLPAQRVVAVISVLEMRRLVRRLGGQYVART